MVAKVAKTDGRIHGKRAAAGKAAKGRRKAARQNLLDVGKSRTHSSVVSERRQQEFVCH